MSVSYSSGHKACSGCGLMIGFKQILNNLNPNSVLVLSSGCLKQVLTDYPLTSLNISAIFCDKKNVLSTAVGVYDIFKKDRVNKDVVVILEDDFFESEFENIDFVFNQKCRLKVFVLDTTGQTSKGFNFKDFRNFYPLICTSFGFKYSASSSISDLSDLTEKVKKMVLSPTPCFLQVYTSCPVGWGVDFEKSVSIIKKGVDSGFFPVVEFENGKLSRGNFLVKEDIFSEFLSLQTRFKDLKPEEKSYLSRKLVHKNSVLRRDLG